MPKTNDVELDAAINRAWTASEDIIALIREHNLEIPEALEALALAIAITAHQDCGSDEEQAMFWMRWMAKRITTMLAGIMENPSVLAYRHIQ